MKSWRVISLVGALVLVAYTCATALGSAVPPTPSPASNSLSSPAFVGVNRRPGFYVIGSANLDAESYGIAGDVQYFRWLDQNPSPGVYSFGGMGAYIEEHAVGGKKVGLSFLTTTTRWANAQSPDKICAEEGMPAWARIPYTSGSIHSATTTIAPPVGPQQGLLRNDLPCEQPIYWSSLYQQYLREWVRALAQYLFVDNPQLGQKVEFINMAHGVDGETRPVDNQDEAHMQSLPGGFTGQMWIDTVNKITDIWMDEFQAKGANVPILLNGAPYYLHPSERAAFTQYAAGVRGAGIAILGLYPDSNGSIYGYAGFCPLCGQHDAIYLYNEQVPIAWETYQHMLPNTRDLYWGILRALDAHSDYVRIRRQFVYEDATGQPVTPNIQIIKQWKDYFGATVNTTPSVWVAMRDHVRPTVYGSQAFEQNTAWPVLGNFEFFMQQVETAPNGKTVIESNTGIVSYGGVDYPMQLGLCPTGNTQGVPSNWPCNENPHNPFLPDSQILGSQGGNQFLSNYEAYFARRTKQETGNDWMMWFDVDDRYHPECATAPGCTVQITVKYFDIGNDKWRLYYNSLSGPTYAAPDGSANTWVQKTGTNQLRTAVFTILDALLNDGVAGMDFGIDSRDEAGNLDGNDSFHLVDLRYVGLGPVTPTPTPTSTPTPTDTPTPTPTPTSTSSTGLVHGIVYNDLNDNNAQDEGEPPVEGAVVAAQVLPSMTEVLTYTTGSTGVYTLTLAPGNYKVLLKEAPPGYVIKEAQHSFFTNVFNGSNFGPWPFPVLEATPTPTPTATSTATPTPTATPTATPTSLSRPRAYMPMISK